MQTSIGLFSQIIQVLCKVILKVKLIYLQVIPETII